MPAEGRRSRSEDSEDNPEEVGVVPFFDVQSFGGAQVLVQAGWASEEQMEEVVINAAAGPGVAQDQILRAFNWWIERQSEIFQASQEPVGKKSKSSQLTAVESSDRTGPHWQTSTIASVSSKNGSTTWRASSTRSPMTSWTI